MNRLSITGTFDVLWQQQARHEKGTKWKTNYKRDLHSNYGYGSCYLTLWSYNIVFCLFNILQSKVFSVNLYVWSGLLQKILLQQNFSNISKSKTRENMFCIFT